MKTFLNIFIVVLIALLSNSALACSCREVNLEYVYQNSSQVYIAEVVAVEKNATVSRHNEVYSNFTAKLKIERVFKGNPKGLYKVKFTDSNYIKGIGIVVGGNCNLSFEVGDKYLVLRKMGEKIQPSWCSPRIRHLDTIDINELERISSGS